MNVKMKIGKEKEMWFLMEINIEAILSQLFQYFNKKEGRRSKC